MEARPKSGRRSNSTSSAHREARLRDSVVNQVFREMIWIEHSSTRMKTAD